MTRVSEAMMELENICSAARWHREHCNENCNVSLYQLGLTAKRLINHCWLNERERARRIIKEVNWT